MENLFSKLIFNEKYKILKNIWFKRRWRQVVLFFLFFKSERSHEVYDLCKKGDQFLIDETGKVYKTENTKREIAFPTCLSVNNCICNYSLVENQSDIILKDEDLVKI